MIFAVAAESVVIVRLPAEIAADRSFFGGRFHQWFQKGRASRDLNGWWECGREDLNGHRCLAAYHSTLGLQVSWKLERPLFPPWVPRRLKITIHRLDDYTEEVRFEINRLITELKHVLMPKVDMVAVRTKCRTVDCNQIVTDFETAK